MITTIPRITVKEFGCGDKNSHEEDVGLVTIIRGYFDDSADDKRKRFSAVGGLIGGAGQWEEFDKRWAVATYNLTEPFHSTDCDSNPPRGGFKGWKKEDCDALMKKLVGIIYSCELHGYASVIPIQEYHSVFPGSDEYDPYFLALKHTLINMAYIGAMITERSRRHAIVGIKICHEESPSTTARAFQTYVDLKALKQWGDGNYLSGFAVGDKKLMALQGADLLAREAFKHADNMGIRRTRKPVKKLKNRIDFHLWNRECLEYLRNCGGPGNLEALTLWGHKKLGDAPRMTLLNSDSGFDY